MQWPFTDDRVKAYILKTYTRSTFTTEPETSRNTSNLLMDENEENAEQEAQSCPICYADLTLETDPLFIIHRASGFQGHIFCPNCLEMHWLGPPGSQEILHNDCPMCRTPVFNPSQIIETFRRLRPGKEFVPYQSDDGHAAHRVWTRNRIGNLRFHMSTEMLEERVFDIDRFPNRDDWVRLECIIGEGMGNDWSERDGLGDCRRWWTSGNQLLGSLMWWARDIGDLPLAYDPLRIMFWIISVVEECTDLLVDEVAPGEFDD
jgi:hypothetical protein